jgi:hypothetical protein
MKPIPLAAYSQNLIPPVTGIGGQSIPVANSYDSSGIFMSRNRAGSASKRKRSEEIDLVFDINAQYPPLEPPQRPVFRSDKIKEMLATAVALSADVRAVLEDPETDPKIKTFGLLSIGIIDALSTIVEDGVLPLAAGGTGGRQVKNFGPSNGGGLAGPPVPAKPQPPNGVRELREGLDKADKETVLFDANLGGVTIANRNNLAAAFSAGIRNAAIEKAAEENKDPAEAVRIVDDALSCVQDMEFIGSQSQKFINRNNESDNRNNTFCTMPIKFKFEDRSMRIHFETVIRSHCGLKSQISLPKPIRMEQAAFLRALKARYPGEIISVRPDIGAATLRAVRKQHGAESWTRCWEVLKLEPGTLLPGYTPREVIALPPLVTTVATIDGDNNS